MTKSMKKFLLFSLLIGIGILCVYYWWIAFPVFLILMIPLVLVLFIDEEDYS